MGHHHAEKRLGAADLKGLYQNIDRRNFLNKTAMGMGGIALQQLITPLGATAATMEEQIMSALPTIAPKAKRVVFLFMAGGPSQFETFDYKPKLFSEPSCLIPSARAKG